jgi:hypothetical protein
VAGRHVSVPQQDRQVRAPQFTCSLKDRPRIVGVFDLHDMVSVNTSEPTALGIALAFHGNCEVELGEANTLNHRDPDLTTPTLRAMRALVVASDGPSHPNAPLKSSVDVNLLDKSGYRSPQMTKTSSRWATFPSPPLATPPC